MAQDRANGGGISLAL